MNNPELRKQWEAKMDEQLELVQEWIDDPEFFEANRMDEIKILEDLTKEEEIIREELDIEKRKQWVGPLWYQISTGWVKAKSDLEYKSAVQLLYEFRAFKTLPKESNFSKLQRFTQVRINGGIRKP